MSLAQTLDRLNRVAQATSRQMDSSLEGYKRLDAAREKILVEEGQRLVPIIREELLRQYSESGLGSPTGDLRNAISQAVVVIQPTRITIRMPSGLPDAFYRAAQSQQSGWVTGGGSKGYKKKVKQGKIRAEGMKVHPARNYFVLDEGAATRLTAEFCQRIQARINMLVAGPNAGSNVLTGGGIGTRPLSIGGSQ